MNLLLVMTNGMSLKMWEQSGQLTREMNIYQKLGKQIGHVYIYSFGKNEKHYVQNYPNITVLDKFWFIPESKYIPKKISKHFNPFYNILSIFFRKKVFRNVDIIKTNQLNGASFAAVLKKIYKKKLVIRMGYYFNRIHGLTKKQENKENKLFKIADHIIISEPIGKKHLENKYKIQPEKISCIHNYVDSEIFKPLSNQPKKYDVLFIGRFEKQKNLFNLLSSLRNSPLKVLFIGNGNLKNDILKQAKEYNINLHIENYLDNKLLPKYYNATDIFILPSLYEGNPKVLIEAMSCGTLCVGTDVEGINNIITDTSNGLLCKTSSDSISHAIKKAINLSQEDKNRIQQNSRKYILDNFSLQTILQKEISLYNKLINA